jgi:rSAM/selenodomain-associated transferase 1
VSPGVALVAKAPVAGRVKTRLCPPLSPAQAAELAAAMLADVAATVRTSGLAAWCVHAGPPEPVRAVVGAGLPLVPQRGDDLGARLAACQRDLVDAGFDPVVLLGGDVPTVEPALLAEAVARAETADVVLGPARDGGYTMLVTHRPTPELFTGVDLGTERVREQTLARAAEAGLTAATVAVRHDLDTLADLHAAREAGELAAAPRTAAGLKRLLGAPPSAGGR